MNRANATYKKWQNGDVRIHVKLWRGVCVDATGKPTGYDRVRNTEIGNKDFELDVLEEAYTTEHWLVRIYKVKDLTNRGN